jgi:hypothetical protein
MGMQDRREEERTQCPCEVCALRKVETGQVREVREPVSDGGHLGCAPTHAWHVFGYARSGGRHASSDVAVVGRRGSRMRYGRVGNAPICERKFAIYKHGICGMHKRNCRIVPQTHNKHVCHRKTCERIGWQDSEKVRVFVGAQQVARTRHALRPDARGPALTAWPGGSRKSDFSPRGRGARRTHACAPHAAMRACE